MTRVDQDKIEQLLADIEERIRLRNYWRIAWMALLVTAWLGLSLFASPPVGLALVAGVLVGTRATQLAVEDAQDTHEGTRALLEQVWADLEAARKQKGETK